MTNEMQRRATEKMEKSLASLAGEFASMRGGRASTSLVDKVMVSYYGTLLPINQLANILTPEARLIVIQPFDKSALGEIEKAILSSDLSLNPSNDGKVLRINVPPLTQERRKELSKLIHHTAEQTRVSIRNIRRDINALIKKSGLPEDEEKRQIDEIQTLTDRYTAKVDALSGEKDKEILEGL